MPPIIETPKDSQHFLDIIDRHLTEHQRTTNFAIAWRLARRVQVSSCIDAPRAIEHYTCKVDETDLPEGVTLTKLV